MTRPSPRWRGRTVVLGMLGAALLSVVGAWVGYALGGRDWGTASAPGSGTTVAGVTTGGSAPNRSASPAQTGSASAAPACLPHTEQLAHRAGSSGGLVQRLYLRTGRSEVWICVDRDGRLFYQGHRGLPGTRLVEGSTALFLTDVVRTDAGYTATNTTDTGTTRYLITTRRLIIKNASGEEVQDVLQVRSYG